MGWVVYGVLLVLFASWMSCHAVLCLYLTGKSWLRGVLAFFALPLAPYWGHAEGFNKLTSTWLVIFSAYFVTLILAFLS